MKTGSSEVQDFSNTLVYTPQSRKNDIRGISFLRGLRSWIYVGFNLEVAM